MSSRSNGCTYTGWSAADNYDIIHIIHFSSNDSDLPPGVPTSKRSNDEIIVTEVLDAGSARQRAGPACIAWLGGSHWIDAECKISFAL